VDEAARGLTLALEALGGPGVWNGADGECAAALLAGLIEDGAALQWWRDRLQASGLFARLCGHLPSADLSV